MRFNCPGCGQPINAPDGAEGQQGGCPSCGKTVTIPSSRAIPKPTTMPPPPQIPQNTPPVLPPQTPAARPFTSTSGTGWIIIGFIILAIASIWTAYYFFGFDTTASTGSYGERVHNTGLMHERTVGIAIGCAAAIGGLLFILAGYLSHCMTYLKESVRLHTQTQKQEKT